MEKKVLVFLGISFLLFISCENEENTIEETEGKEVNVPNTPPETSTPTPDPTNPTYGNTKLGHLNLEKDLLLAHYDCKTDVDDLHSVAAFATLLSNDKFYKINFHAVAGTYGKQGGLYVPPNDLFNLVFKNKWSDAHADPNKAVDEVKALVKPILENNGDVWIAEGGQSHFSLKLIRVIETELPDIDLSKRIHVVQHSEWNEKMTGKRKLNNLKEKIDYHKIADGNKKPDGTPIFESPNYTNWSDKVKNPNLIKVWELAIKLANDYNGVDKRYENPAIKANGLDFSDTSEIFWILKLQDIENTEDFFNLYSN